MAIFHYSDTVIRRCAGRSATAAAAYQAGDKRVDQRTGKIHDDSHQQWDLNQLYWQQQRRLEKEQARRQSREPEWERSVPGQ